MKKWKVFLPIILAFALIVVFLTLSNRPSTPLPASQPQQAQPAILPEPSPTTEPTATPSPSGKAEPSQSANTTKKQPNPTRTARKNPQPTASKTKPSTQPKPAKTALAQLRKLKVRNKSYTGYVRNEFGNGWAKYNGCDTRNRILQRDLTKKTSSDGCRILTGKLQDPYTGKTISFKRGVETSQAVQIDHVVALSNAWKSGAATWSDEKRRTFANDPLNLLAVDGPANMQKGDKHAGEWLPANQAFQCEYVALQIAIKAKYRLTITTDEHRGMREVLERGCSKEPAATEPNQKSTAIKRVSTPKPAAKKDPKDKPTRGEVYYQNCAQVRAKGKAPLYRGDPGYRAGLDRDNDGIACE